MEGRLESALRSGGSRARWRRVPGDALLVEVREELAHLTDAPRGTDRDGALVILHDEVDAAEAARPQ